jgi:hypothetical protein
MKSLFLFLVVIPAMASYGQSGSEIYLFDIKVKNGQVTISGGINITNHKGYDNQPFFHPSRPIVFYSSFNDSGRSDIKYYDFKKKTTGNLTLTSEREYSPTVTPDGKFISCIIQRDNGAQDLAKYPISGGKSIILINDMTIGYHAWVDNHKLTLFVLEDSARHTLHYYNLSTKEDTTLAVGIGRSLHRIPGQQAMSFIQKVSDSLCLVKGFDPATLSITTLAQTVKGSDHIAWLKNNTILTSSNNQVFYYQLNREASWQPVIVEGDTSLLKGVTRLAANADNTKLAVVVSE